MEGRFYERYLSLALEKQDERSVLNSLVQDFGGERESYVAKIRELTDKLKSTDEGWREKFDSLEKSMREREAAMLSNIEQNL